jgi:hypothetical protein
LPSTGQNEPQPFKPARVFLIWFFQIRMAAAGRTNLLEALAARRPSSAPPSEHLQDFAGVRERAGRGLLERDRVRARNDPARCAVMPRFFLIKLESFCGGTMSAEIIEFVQRPKQQTRFFDFPVPTRSAFRADDLTMGHADTPARCENVLSIDEYRANRNATS